MLIFSFTLLYTIKEKKLHGKYFQQNVLFTPTRQNIYMMVSRIDD